jgi:hypothetical protein
MYQFTDSEFMTAKDKELVIRQWETFLNNGLQRKHFTDRLYKHLTLHCSFIAHYSIHGFYQTYFESPQASINFLSQFDKDKGNISVEYGATYWLNGDYEDINKAMIGVAERYKAGLYQSLGAAKNDKWELLLQSVEKAKGDQEYRERLLKVLDLI